jgi:hypothetical protein
MTKEELIEFLKDNLTVEVNTDSDGGIDVILKLDGEEISRSSGYIST